MPKPLYKLPRHFVKEWPEIFEDLYVNTMPVYYIEFVRLEFKNGRVWEINVKDQLLDSHAQIISDRLVETFHEYRDDITKIDFRFDIARLKKDISDSTSKIL
jgi:hypothetical protein